MKQHNCLQYILYILIIIIQGMVTFDICVTKTNLQRHKQYHQFCTTTINVNNASEMIMQLYRLSIF